VIQVRQDLSTNTEFQLHAGNTSVWSAPWYPLWDSIHDHLLLPVTTIPLPTTASDLWHPNTYNWTCSFWITLLMPKQSSKSSLRAVLAAQNDILHWKPAKNGVCTTKEIYKHLSNLNTIQLPHQRSRSILPLRPTKFSGVLGNPHPFLQLSKPSPGDWFDVLSPLLTGLQDTPTTLTTTVTPVGHLRMTPTSFSTATSPGGMVPL
jgi:hypothetical protein